jgi:hypothetical protein
MLEEIREAMMKLHEFVLLYDIMHINLVGVATKLLLVRADERMMRRLLLLISLFIQCITWHNKYLVHLRWSFFCPLKRAIILYDASRHSERLPLSGHKMET